MINYAHLKSQMIQLLDLLRSILYPNVFDAMEEAHSKEELETAARRQLREILERIYREPPQYDDVIDTLFSKLPAIRDTLDTDVQAAYEGDPAATCPEEVMLAYPAFEAISIFRIAHELYLMKVPMLPRMMTEYAHSLTGIDIHPGATIGPYFFIDHGTGVVIGETTEETKKVFKDKSLEMNAPIRFAEEEHEVISSRSEGNTRVYETLHYGSFIGELGGLCQEKNTATILTAIDELRKAGYTIAQEHIRLGFGQVCKLTGLRGRWQQVGMSPTIICDTGHNTGGISYIADQLRGVQADKLHIVIGMVNDKDIHSVLRQLPQCATYYFTKANVKRALDEHTLQTLAKEAGLRGTSWPDVRSAFQAARQSSTEKDLIFVGGSTFIVADFLAFYHPEQA